MVIDTRYPDEQECAGERTSGENLRGKRASFWELWGLVGLAHRLCAQNTAGFVVPGSHHGAGFSADTSFTLLWVNVSPKRGVEALTRCFLSPCMHPGWGKSKSH